MSFADMKKRSKSNLSSLIKETEKISNPNTFGEVDDRYWRPELDKSGNGYAVVRFFRLQMEKNYLGLVFGIMVSKVQAVGTLRTL